MQKPIINGHVIKVEVPGGQPSVAALAAEVFPGVRVLASAALGVDEWRATTETGHSFEGTTADLERLAAA